MKDILAQIQQHIATAVSTGNPVAAERWLSVYKQVEEISAEWIDTASPTQEQEKPSEEFRIPSYEQFLDEIRPLRIPASARWKLLEAWYKTEAEYSAFKTALYLSRL